MVTDICTRFPESDDLGVCGWIGISEIAIPASTHDLAFADHDRPDGHRARFQGALRGSQGL